MRQPEWVRLESKDKKPKRDLDMACDNCGTKYKRWDIEMVEPNEQVFKVKAPYHYACPPCRTFLELAPLQTQRAKDFRATNELLRKNLDETIIN